MYLTLDRPLNVALLRLKDKHVNPPYPILPAILSATSDRMTLMCILCEIEGYTLSLTELSDKAPATHTAAT